MAQVAEIFRWVDFANNARPLVSRPILPWTFNSPAFKQHIHSISLSVYVGGVLQGSPITLDVDKVMFEDRQEWGKDRNGYTFLYPAPGSLWPDPDKTYRVVITFVPKDDDGGPLATHTFIEIWEVTTISHLG
jgi:hypothetical protein